MRIINKAKISEYTSYKLDGEIKKLYIPEDILELKKLLDYLKDNNIRYKILGNGSNLIISHKYDGVLIKLSKFDKPLIESIHKESIKIPLSKTFTNSITRF